MVDVHCHLNFNAFEKDCDEVIQRALEAGVTKIINVGTSIESSQKAVELAQKYENLYAIVGIHPHHADKVETAWLRELELLAKMPKVVGIGECGLDYYRYKSSGIVNPLVQKEVFIKQIKLAHALSLPLQIHNRQAGEDVIEILLNHKSYLLNIPGMFHCFAGTKEVLKSALDMGFYIGFDGNITYKGIAQGETTTLFDLVLDTPVERIVSETDSPFLTPIPHRGSRNTPEYVILVGKFIARIKNILPKELDKQTTANAAAVFKI